MKMEHIEEASCQGGTWLSCCTDRTMEYLKKLERNWRHVKFKV